MYYSLFTSSLKVFFNEMSVQIKKSSKLKDSLNWMGEMVREVWQWEREREREKDKQRVREIKSRNL